MDLFRASRLLSRIDRSPFRSLPQCQHLVWRPQSLRFQSSEPSIPQKGVHTSPNDRVASPESSPPNVDNQTKPPRPSSLPPKTSGPPETDAYRALVHTEKSAAEVVAELFREWKARLDVNENAPFRPDASTSSNSSAPIRLSDVNKWAEELKQMDKSANLNPKMGRSVTVRHTADGADLVRKLGALSRLVKGNAIPGDFRAQQFHERPGLKRKRLKRERWRKRFSHNFMQICSRAESLARKGW